VELFVVAASCMRECWLRDEPIVRFFGDSVKDEERGNYVSF
jgi:hypothetical protein